MIITAELAPVLTANVDNTQKDAVFSQTSFLQLKFSQTDIVNGVASWTDQTLWVRPGAVVNILSCGIKSPAGIVHGENRINLSVCHVDTAFPDEDGVVVYGTKIPFIPVEYQTGKEIFIPKDYEGNAEFQLACDGSISTLGLPDEYNGAPIPLTAFVKFDIDERMVVM